MTIDDSCYDRNPLNHLSEWRDYQAIWGKVTDSQLWAGLNPDWITVYLVDRDRASEENEL
jgi:hypothetical protein